MPNTYSQPTPRPLLKLSLIALVTVMGLPARAWAPYRYRHAIDDPLRQQKSPVLEVYGEYAIRGTKVHMPSLRLMLSTGVKKLAGTNDLHKAWRYFIHDDDVVAITFTHVGGRALGTNRKVAAALLQSLYKAGFKPENLLLVGLEELPEEAQGTRLWRYGWQSKPTDFGSGSDCLAGWLDDVTAIINVPTLMDDNIIGLRAALANLTWPLLKNPARFYMCHGDPFIPEIYYLPQVRGKVRLHVANALRVLYYGGPLIKQRYADERATLIFSADPVALDRVALELIRQIRRERPMPPDVDERITAPYLDTAYALGIGYNDLNFIDYERIDHDDEE